MINKHLGTSTHAPTTRRLAVKAQDVEISIESGGSYAQFCAMGGTRKNGSSRLSETFPTIKRRP